MYSTIHFVWKRESQTSALCLRACYNVIPQLTFDLVTGCLIDSEDVHNKAFLQMRKGGDGGVFNNPQSLLISAPSAASARSEALD